ncbi:glycosyltransferase family 4 protein [Ferruginibacter paludis]|uniref:glycosyltransferase family 4 protein n=1 Tax=Ferruginibacter paludis TaxID=1310417 RepID=UPI0025B3E972|nr:glycosyltransferase family 4 protein [Ferruginibacter paludis]MDN3655855.1 glycosyltransferase family 4 protein [Ferruginibacter paludis]
MPPLKKLAIITTHPIQYNAPWFKLLNERGTINVKVFYTWGQLEHQQKLDPDFGKNVDWDIPLLDGYPYQFVENVSAKPGSHHFNGIDNPGLINEIEFWYPDAILILGWCFKSHLKVLRHFKGKKPVIFRGDSTLIDEVPAFSIKKMARKTFLSWIYSHINIALYVGTANKAYYNKYGLAERQLIFAPHAIDNERFMKPVSKIDRMALGIPNAAAVFIFVGKMERKKNPFLLLNSFIELDDAIAHLLFVGNGVLETELKTTVNNLPALLSERIHFLPFQNQLQMPSIYHVGDVLVLPSKGPGETWGLAVNEAMACGKAVLVSDKCGCAPDLIDEGVNGYTFKSTDKEGLIAKMKSLLSHRSKLQEMGIQSLNKISQWNFGEICSGIERAMAKL